MKIPAVAKINIWLSRTISTDPGLQKNPGHILSKFQLYVISEWFKNAEKPTSK